MDAKHCKTIEQHNNSTGRLFSVFSTFFPSFERTTMHDKQLYFFFFCHLNPEDILAKQDLNSVLENGDSLYNFIDKSG